MLSNARAGTIVAATDPMSLYNNKRAISIWRGQQMKLSSPNWNFHFIEHGIHASIEMRTWPHCAVGYVNKY